MGLFGPDCTCETRNAGMCCIDAKRYKAEKKVEKWRRKQRAKKLRLMLGGK